MLTSPVAAVNAVELGRSGVASIAFCRDIIRRCGIEYYLQPIEDCRSIEDSSYRDLQCKSAPGNWGKVREGLSD